MSMDSLLTSNKRAFLATTTLALLAAQIPSCSGNSNSSGPVQTGTIGGTGVNSAGGNAAGTSATSGLVSAGGSGSGTGGTSTTNIATGGTSPATAGGTSANGGTSATGGIKAAGGVTQTGGVQAAGGVSAAGTSSQYVVSLIQSTEANASNITQDEIKTMVTNAVTEAGGLDFISDGMTVVLKPNLLTPLQACWFGTAMNPPAANGVTTDWRIVKATADLVRTKNPTGKILVMEGSAQSTTAAYTALGYTTANFGTSVDEFIALEGTACGSKDATGLIQEPGKSGTQYWINQRYFLADVLISIGAMKTHSQAGITGSVKNLGIGATPGAKYSASTSSSDCTRNQSQSGVSSYIDHSFSGLGDFVSDFYSVKPADFAILDGLQGLQNGPCSGSSSDRMNMRLILASKNAVALDTVEAAVMNCTGSKVPYLTTLEGWGLGTTDLTKISVVGNVQVSDVKKSFAGAAGGVCN